MFNSLTSMFKQLIEGKDLSKMICSSQTGHLAMRHFAFQSSLGLGTQEHYGFSPTLDLRFM
ncbi:hypothetical protein BCT90_14085 [Vibrio lentus]|nr:hypothetical protein BCU56_12945 [Vibrio lentus]PMI04525.1 hypothetical protein BCU53_16745 [Vibrio lentus]PMJ14197.1 hypothetical protein BCU29_15625 [Vibrio lentus]PML08595.1 hypothetical protein BCT90_14085 [Vibrio lentus]